MWYFRPLFIVGGVITAVLVVIIFAIQMFHNGSVALSVEVEHQGKTLVIHGETNLPTRTVIAYEVAPKDLATRQEEGVYASGITFVKNGKYQAMLDTSLFPKGEIIVWARLIITKAQPLMIQERYGLGGAELKGPNVMKDSESQWVEVSKEIKI